MRKNLQQNEKIKETHFDFIAIGLANHALCLLEYAGILEVIKRIGEFHQSQLQDYKNPHLIRAALVTLVGANVLMLNNDTYKLTELGENLAKNIGALMLIFGGYRNLLAKQFQLLDEPTNWKDSEIDYPLVALSSIGFGLHDLDPLILDIFKIMRPKGTICDLGCGTGEKLVKICRAFNSSGLGIERDPDVIEKSKKFVDDCSLIEIIQGDITNLKGVWEDVEVIMISFVYHDITPSKKGIKFLKSLKKHFPRFRCLINIDIVSLSEDISTIMPGFDYAHGLQGITPRNYNEILDTYNKANFKVLREISVPNMSNTFIWILEP